MDAGDQLNISIHDSAGRPGHRDQRPHDQRAVGVDDGERGATGSRRSTTSRPRRPARRRRTRSTRCTRRRASTRASRGRRTRTTWPSRTRSATSSTATTRTSTASASTPGVGDNKKDGDDVACFNADESLRSRSAAASRPTTTSTGSPTRPTWPGRLTDPRRTPRYIPQSVLFSSPTFGGGQNYEPRRVRGGPAADRGRRLRRDLQPDHRRGLREPAAGLELLPVLQHPETTPRSAAFGSSAGRTSRGRRTPSAGTPPPSSVPCCSWTTRDRDSPRSTGPTTSDRCWRPTPVPTKAT